LILPSLGLNLEQSLLGPVPARPRQTIPSFAFVYSMTPSMPLAPLVRLLKRSRAESSALTQSGRLLLVAVLFGGLLIGPEEKSRLLADESNGISENEEILFEKHVRPILKAQCFHCHGEEPELAGGLDLRLVRLMYAGGDSGPAIERGSAGQSILLERIVSGEMPPSGKKLNESEQQTIARWLQQGARTVRPEHEDPNQAKFTDEELSHWAFQVPQKPLVPVMHRADDENLAQHPIDNFVGQRLQQAGLSFAGAADRATLLRRLTFDLHGLPPTKAQLDQFLTDQRPDAYERQVDRLLASPQYGVRWGRHWLDTVGYAESDGNITNDQLRPHAWLYRDYVIAALNDDKPYDQFLVEQLAGDELIEGAVDGNNLRHVELMSATGLLRMAPDVTQTDNSLMDRNQVVAEVLNVVGTGILGVTVGCAQCHDHRYDPVSIEDYYRLRAVFDPAFPLHQWKKPSERLVDMTDDISRATADDIEKQAVAMQEDIDKRRREHGQTIQEREIAKVPEELREQIRTAVNAKPAEQTEAQKELLDRYPTVRTIDKIVGQLVEFDRKAHDAFQAEEKKVAELRGTKPLQRLVMTVLENRSQVPVSNVLFRGSPDSPTTEVLPNEITALVSARKHVTIPALSDQLTRTTGRRLAYAMQLTDGTHPTVARVLVNRVWQHHFGQGLVGSSGDFGLAGDAPSHPELLDWLAVDFVEHGWSIKRLHKQILMTHTYRQSVVHATDDVIAIDPENRLLGRASLRRLDAESLRDAVLHVSGQLNRTMGGPSVPVTEDGEGKAVLGTQNRRNGLFESVSATGADAFRRSIFIATVRSLPLNELQTFDLPDMTPNCQVRSASTVAQQALFFLNDEFIVEASMRMAESLTSQHQDRETQIGEMFIRLFSSSPTDSQLNACLEFLQLQAQALSENSEADWKKQIADNPGVVAKTALANLCQTLLASNPFLYVH
jgi:hypothetical protein